MTQLEIPIQRGYADWVWIGGGQRGKVFGIGLRDE